MPLRKLLCFETRFVFLQIHILLWIARSFCFYLFLYPMCCQGLDDQHPRNYWYSTGTRQPEQHWPKIIVRVNHFTSTQQKGFWGTTPYISSLCNIYMKNKNMITWQFHIGIQSTFAHWIGDFTSPMAGQQL